MSKDKVVVDLGENASAMLQQLADKMGVGAEFIWEVTLAQAKIVWAYKLTYILFSMAFVWLLNGMQKKAIRETPDEESVIILSITKWLAVFSFILTFSFNITELLNSLVNPQYLALQHILTTVRGLK